MKDFFKKLLDQVGTLWGKWSWIQRLVLIGFSLVVVIGFIFMMVFVTSPDHVSLVGTPIKDQKALLSITARLDQENIPYTASEDGYIYLSNQKIAQKARAILFRENLIPKEIDPWAIFDIERWSITDFERDINKRRAITAALEQHIAALDDIDSVNIELVLPEDKLFKEDQKATTASVQISPKPGSDITTNRRKIEGIVKLITFAVEGLIPENVVVTDHSGIVLNDFSGLADVDRLELGKREISLKSKMETEYKGRILLALKDIYKTDRVRIVNLDLTLNTDKQIIDKEEYTPIVLEPANPKTNEPRKVQESIVLSQNTKDVNFEGTGFNPEGPPGNEGQTPPAYKDLSNLAGRYKENSKTVNNVVNMERSKIEKSPIRITRIAIGVVLDGIWAKSYDPKTGELQLEPNGGIKRTYYPVTPEELQKAKSVLQAAVGYDFTRGDMVTVEHIPFDRTAQFEKEDDDLRGQYAMRRIFFVALIALLVVLGSFVIFRLISREMERRRRLREEELSRQHQAMREAALHSAEEQGIEVEMSVAERSLLELQETAINMAREHPDDVAKLIRTWLAEE